MIQTAVITGVASGIGKTTSQLFIRHNWFVVGIDQKDVEPGECCSVFINANVADQHEWDRVAYELKTNGVRQIKTLVNNAAIQVHKPLLETTLDEWDLVLSSNLVSIFLATRKILPLMAPDSSIVNVSSVHALATSKGLSAYAASKGALLTLTRSMAIEFAPFGIRVNTVLPGTIDTPMLREGLVASCSESGLSDAMVRLKHSQVLGRIGSPTEVAQAILFLADQDRSSFITGTALIVDGGATARLSTSEH